MVFGFPHIVLRSSNIALAVAFCKVFIGVLFNTNYWGKTEKLLRRSARIGASLRLHYAGFSAPYSVISQFYLVLSYLVESSLVSEVSSELESSSFLSPESL